MDITIGPLQPDEVPAFCDLFWRVFGVTMTPELRAWKYEFGPRLGSISLVARSDTGILVGHAGALIFPGERAGRPVPMAQVCDVQVDASARGGLDSKSVYARLMKALQLQLAKDHPGVFAYGFAGVRPYKLGARMGLYRCVQPIRMGRWDANATREGHSLPTSVITPLARLRQWWSALGPQSQVGRLSWPWSLKPLTWDSPAFEQVWRQIAGTDVGPVVQRSVAYLNWRYANHPLHHYKAWVLSRLGVPRAWAITREMADGSHCLIDSLSMARVGWDAVMRGLLSHYGSITSWDIETEVSAGLEPIMACEVFVDHWHSDNSQPRFHPGDTDVF